MAFVKIVILLNIFQMSIVVCKNYETKLLSLEKCKVPENYYDQQNILYVSMSSKRVNRTTSVVTSVFNVSKNTGPITFSFRAYQLQRSLVRDLEFKSGHLSCSNNITMEMARLLKINIDKNCILKPGFYLSDNIDIARIGSIFSTNIVTSGKYAYDIELETKTGVITCISIAMEFTLK